MLEARPRVGRRPVVLERSAVGAGDGGLLARGRGASGEPGGRRERRQRPLGMIPTYSWSLSADPRPGREARPIPGHPAFMSDPHSAWPFTDRPARLTSGPCDPVWALTSRPVTVAAGLLFASAAVVALSPLRLGRAAARSGPDPAPTRGTPDRRGVRKADRRLAGVDRDRAVVDELERGNLPSFLGRPPRQLRYQPAGAPPVAATIWVTPDYLAIGRDDDFLYLPLTYYSATDVAHHFGCVLPTAEWSTRSTSKPRTISRPRRCRPVP